MSEVSIQNKREPIYSKNSELRSCIYEGVVTHRRTIEFEHSFKYRLFLLYLDLDELDEVFQGRIIWSTKRIAPARFRREDHIGNPEVPLADAVRQLVQFETGSVPSGPIRLLTNLRYYGFQMNPVSFYYCFDESEQHIEFVVAEVHNTPWGEQHCYVLPWQTKTEEGNEHGESTPVIPKEFHVSPFLPMDMLYHWKIGFPGDKLGLQIENTKLGNRAFHAALALKRVPISTWNLNSRMVRYPWMTGKVFAGIYWQALKLWWKGATYFPHPHKTPQPELVGTVDVTKPSK